MITADRREGGLLPEIDPRSGSASIWRTLDRSIPLGVKLAIPVIVITLAGTMLFGLVLAQQAQATADATTLQSARRVADAAGVNFYTNFGNSARVDEYLGEVVRTEPNLLSIWIIEMDQAGDPVVGSSVSNDLGRTGVVDSSDITAARGGSIMQNHESVNGSPVLETTVPIQGGVFAVVVRTSLAQEQQALTSTLVWIGIGAALVCIVEVAAMMAILELGVLGRIRRVRALVDSFGQGPHHTRLPEGFEREGRDALFNLARKVDQKLVELSDRERAEAIVSELGQLTLEGVKPAVLRQKALDLTQRAAGLDHCFIVDLAPPGSAVESLDGNGTPAAAAKLPVWLAALVRAASLSKRPIVADRLGEGSRFWSNEAPGPAAAAAFVPVPGTPTPVGVMVGIAFPGSELSTVSVNLMEGVATALGEAVQRTETEKARSESDVKTQALATVSHEMRDPLNAMLGFSELLLSGAAGALNEKQLTYVHQVDDASRHLLSLVNDYLDLSRVLAGSLPMHPEEVSVAPEVDYVLELLKPAATEKNVVLRSKSSPTAIAHVDRLRLRQVLMNLVGNAIKFTPARGWVSVEAAGGSNGVRISVIDTGVGIPSDRQHLVFTEFAQLRHEGGELSQGGLGLALTKRFVEAMGGFIRFTSSEGAGTIFDVWLPGERTPKSAGAPDEGASAGSAA